jgi:hypothetical protein
MVERQSVQSRCAMWLAGELRSALAIATEQGAPLGLVKRMYAAERTLCRGLDRDDSAELAGMLPEAARAASEWTTWTLETRPRLVSKRKASSGR